MENSTKITIEDLAVALNGKMWVKEDLKRIYLDEGYNTKKMSTKTYVEIRNGEFVVRCFIDCPSQNDNWIDSQQDQIIESVGRKIEEIIELTKVELVEARLSADETEVEVRISYNNTVEENWLTEEQFDERFNKYPQSVFENLPETKVIVKETKEPIIAEPVYVAPVSEKGNHKLGDGVKVSHARFGRGEILEDLEGGSLRILFETVGEKILLVRFANLTYL